MLDEEGNDPVSIASCSPITHVSAWGCQRSLRWGSGGVPWDQRAWAALTRNALGGQQEDSQPKLLKTGQYAHEYFTGAFLMAGAVLRLAALN